VGPGETAWLQVEPLAAVLPPPRDALDPLSLDTLEIRVLERRLGGPEHPEREVASWVVALADRPPLRAPSSPPAGDGEAIVPRDGFLELRGGGTTARFDALTGALVAIERDGAVLGLRGGATAVGEAASRPDEVAARRGATGEKLVARYPGLLRNTRWRLDGDGWLRLSYQIDDDGASPAVGIAFAGLPWHDLRRVDWVGGGPFRVWGNRLEGASLGRWSLDADAREGALPWVTAELQGAHSGVRWMRLELAGGALIVAPANLAEAPAPDLDSNLPMTLGAPFLWLSTPAFPAGARSAVAELPPGLDVTDGFAVLHRIPPIGTKFHEARAISPRAALASSSHEGEIALLWSPAP
jgi:hypothetical protein